MQINLEETSEIVPPFTYTIHINTRACVSVIHRNAALLPRGARAYVCVCARARTLMLCVCLSALACAKFEKQKEKT